MDINRADHSEDLYRKKQKLGVFWLISSPISLRLRWLSSLLFLSMQ